MENLLPHADERIEATSSVTGFEGFEKRLEIEFFAPPLPLDTVIDPKKRGLRELARHNLNEVLKAAQCTIVCELSNEFVDSYVLSESSLFVYPYKIVLKTCGTTRPLNAVPSLIHFASGFGLKAKCCKYTRGDFMFPSLQCFPHRSFPEEVSLLQEYLGSLGLSGRAYVMGNAGKLQNWHVYCAAAAADEDDDDDRASFTLELSMTQLDNRVRSKFFKHTCSTASDMTLMSGIHKLLGSSDICDYAFDPCGYSMNGVEGTVVSTVHVTPEEGCSYASFEMMGDDPMSVNLQSLVDEVTSCFKPATFSLVVRVKAGAPSNNQQAFTWGEGVCPSGYHCNGACRQELPGRCIAAFQSFSLISSDNCAHP